MHQYLVYMYQVQGIPYHYGRKYKTCSGIYLKTQMFLTFPPSVIYTGIQYSTARLLQLCTVRTTVLVVYLHDE